MEETREQCKIASFFKYRAGRIGASVSGAVAHSNPSQPSQSLIKSICYPSLLSATTKATGHGIKYESEVIRAYAEESDGSCSDDVEFVKEAFAKTNKYAALSALSNTDNDPILSPTGWLTCDIIQQTQCLFAKGPPCY